jgi:hypothetical protein
MDLHEKTMRLVALSILLLSICIFGVSATTYPKLTTKQLKNISDVNIIGTIVSQTPTFNKELEICDSISEVNVYYSFTNGINIGDKITINTYSGMDNQDVYLLYLTRTTKTKNLKASTNNQYLKFEEQEHIRCKDAKQPAYEIMMEGLGSQEIVLDKNGSIGESYIEFKMNWLVPPEELEGVTTGSDWDEIKKIKASDFIYRFEQD